MPLRKRGLVRIWNTLGWGFYSRIYGYHTGGVYCLWNDDCGDNLFVWIVECSKKMHSDDRQSIQFTIPIRKQQQKPFISTFCEWGTIEAKINSKFMNKINSMFVLCSLLIDCEHYYSCFLHWWESAFCVHQYLASVLKYPFRKYSSKSQNPIHTLYVPGIVIESSILCRIEWKISIEKDLSKLVSLSLSRAPHTIYSIRITFRCSIFIYFLFSLTLFWVGCNLIYIHVHMCGMRHEVCAEVHIFFFLLFHFTTEM